MAVSIAQLVDNFLDEITFVFSGDDIQTTSIAIVITGSVCCSLVWMLYSLFTDPKSTQRGHLKLFSINRALSAQTGKTTNTTNDLLKFSDKKWKSSQSHLTKNNFHLEQQSGSCIQLGLQAADHLYSAVRCALCCIPGTSSGCPHFPSTSPQNMKTKPGFTPSHSELDLSHLWLEECPGRVLLVGSKLTVLNLSHNRLCCLPPEVCCLHGLKVLHVRHNNLQQLPDKLSHLQCLLELDVSHNELNVLPHCVGELKQLHRLIASHNQLLSLPETLQQLQQLTHLDVSYNRLSSVPDLVYGLTNLVMLNFSENATGELSGHICRLRRLSELHLRGCNLKCLPVNIGLCSCLVTLDISKNRLYELPWALGGLYSLNVLRADQNDLCYLPASLLCLNLEQLTARSNPFWQEDDVTSEGSTLVRKPGQGVTAAPLWEWAARLCSFSTMSSALLPTTLKDELSAARHCSNCGQPLFCNFMQKLTFQAHPSSPSLPFCQLVCPPSLAAHCSFQEIS